MKRLSVPIIGIFIVMLLLLSFTFGCSPSPSTAPASKAPVSAPAPVSTPQPQAPSSAPAAPQASPAPAQAAQQKVFTMNIQIMHARMQALVQQVQIPFTKTLEEKSGGRLKVNIFDMGAVSPPGSTVAALASNVLQAAWLNPGWEPGRFPLTDLPSLPFLFPSATVSNQAVQNLIQTTPSFLKQWPAEVKIMCGDATALLQFMSVKKQVKTLEDLKGMRILCKDSTDERVTSLLGANPITLAITGMSDWYLALQRGMGDGFWNPISPSRAMKIGEVAKYFTLTNHICGTWYFGVNQGFYNSLPDDLKKILDEETGMKLSEASGRLGLDMPTMTDGKFMKDTMGVTYYTLPDAEKAKWKERLSPIQESLTKDLISKGYSASDINSMIATTDRFVSESVKKGAYVPDYSELSR